MGKSQRPEIINHKYMLETVLYKLKRYFRKRRIYRNWKKTQRNKIKRDKILSKYFDGGYNKKG